MPYRSSSGKTTQTPVFPGGAMEHYTPKPFGIGLPQKPSFFQGLLQNISGAGQDLANQLAAVAQTRQPQEQQDPLEALLQGLAGDLNTGGSGLNQADYEQALNNSAAQIKKAFGAEIGAVRASSAAARKQTKRGKKQVRAMYNALSKEYKKAAQAELASGNQIQNELGAVATNAQGQVQQSADKILNDQAALAQSLGVQSAAPEAAARVQGAVQDTVNRMQSASQNDRDMAVQFSGAQQRFLDRGGQNALLEGTNRRADLVDQLQAFLQQNLGKIADIKGRQGQALADNASKVASSFSQGASDAAQNKFDNGVTLAKLLLSLRGQQQDSNSVQKDSLPSWMRQQQGIVGNDPQVAGLLDSLFSTPDFVNQQYRSGKQDFRMNPIKAGDEAYQAAIDAGLTQQQAIAARLAAMIQQQGLG